MSKEKEVSPYKTVFDEGNAYWMARLASEVYTKVSEDNEKPDEGKILASLKEDDDSFRSVVGVDKNSAQAALIEHDDYLCMAFRGTNELADWLDNIKIYRKEVLFGEFHAGFWDSVEDVWDVLFHRYKELRETRKRPLFFTGHSLGGAMATIAAARFLHDDRPFTAVYTFGQPRTMNRATARIYNSEVRNRHYRFQNNEDIVTRAPARLAGYRHVGNCCYIDNDGYIQNDPGRWDRFLDVFEGAVETLKERGSVGLISDHNMENYLKAIEMWNKLA